MKKILWRREKKQHKIKKQSMEYTTKMSDHLQKISAMKPYLPRVDFAIIGLPETIVWNNTWSSTWAKRDFHAKAVKKDSIKKLISILTGNYTLMSIRSVVRNALQDLIKRNTTSNMNSIAKLAITIVMCATNHFSVLSRSYAHAWQRHTI